MKSKKTNKNQEQGTALAIPRKINEQAKFLKMAQ